MGQEYIGHMIQYDQSCYGRNTELGVRVMMSCLGWSLTKMAQYILKKEIGYNVTCLELIDRLSSVRECSVVLNVDGIEKRPVKAFSHLNEEGSLVWTKTMQLLELLDRWSSPDVKDKAE